MNWNEVAIAVFSGAIGFSAAGFIIGLAERYKANMKGGVYRAPVDTVIDDTRPAFTQGQREMCGGCGKMKAPQELEACAGEVCHDYVMGARGSDMVCEDGSPMKKIPIGYTGHLHVLK